MYRDLERRGRAAGLAEKDLPKNEGQIRPLLVLRDADTQWKVWNNAVQRQQDRPRPLTAAHVKEAVGEERADQKAGIRKYLRVDTTYHGIPYRLDLVTPSDEPGYVELVCDLDELEQYYAEWQPDDISASPPLVLVCPEYDLFGDIQDEGRAYQLLEVFRRIPTYRFLIWTSGETWASHIVLPDNVEWVFRIRTEYMSKEYTPSVSYTRQLIDVLPSKEIDDPAFATKVRALLADILNTDRLIHMTRQVSDLLGTDKVGKSTIEPVVATRETGGRPETAPRYDKETRNRMKAIFDLNKQRY